jgi:cyanophycinase
MTPGRGTLALVGAGEFLDSMASVDAVLLERAGGRRVAVLPTASAPDGPAVPQGWADLGVAHFSALGAQPMAVMALDRAGCESPDHAAAVSSCHLVYFSGGKPDYLLTTLAGTRVWQAVLGVLEKGGLLAGCSAGAMILGGWIPVRPNARLSLWRRAFALVPESIIMPHFDEIPAWVTTPLRWLRPRRAGWIGIDGGTALVGPAGGAGDWQALGRGRVVASAGSQTATYRGGATFTLRP